MDVYLSAPPLAPALVPLAPPSRTPTADPELSVVVVNYRHWEETGALVRRLRASECLGDGEAEVVVVDNHSPPHHEARRLRRDPDVSVRRWGRNRGFGRAVNEGCRLARGHWLLLLNPDVTPTPEFLDGVRAVARQLAEERPRVGIVGFRLRDPDGTVQGSTGPFPNLVGTVLRLLLPRPRRKYHLWSPRRPGPVPWVTGCCLLVRRDCLEQLGRVDPDFFLYYEDVDLCRRAGGAGWVVWFEPSLEVVHHRPLHVRAVPPHLRLITRHALLTYAAKHWPRWQARLLAGIVRLEAGVRRVVAKCRGDGSEDVFAELGQLAAAMGRGDYLAARRLLVRAVRGHERAAG